MISSLSHPHIAAVYEGPSTNICRIHVDGKLVIRDDTVLVRTVEGKKWNIGQNGGTLKGIVDEALFLDEALTAEDVVTLFRFGRKGIGVGRKPEDCFVPLSKFRIPKKKTR